MTDQPSWHETRFEDPGTLRKPGPIGRLVRFVLGAFLAYEVWLLWTYPQVLVRDGAPHWSALLGLLFALWLIPPVFNLGLGFSAKLWPRYVVAGAILGWMVTARVSEGVWWTPELGRFVWLFLLYTFGHLGLSFLLASAIATPGCEMRAIPHLWTLVSGRETKEHYCPGFFDGLDRWEAGREAEAT